MKNCIKPAARIALLMGTACLLTDADLCAGPRGKADIAPALQPHDKLSLGQTDHAAGQVDAYLASYWTRTGVTPASVIGDAAFLRRASLALNGVSPTKEEVLAFLESNATDKREIKVNELLTRSRYADYWGFRFRDWITQIREVKGQSTNLATLYYYSRQAMAENRSWARIAQDLLATDGDVSQHGWANFPLYFDTEANEVAEAATRMFLGTNLACAQCHDDPYVDKWTQKSYWGMAAFFARAKIKHPGDEYYDRFPLQARPVTSVSTLPGGDASVDGVWGDVRAYVESDKGEARIPGSDDTIIMPTPLGQSPIVDADGRGQTRRAQFVSWIVDANNPLFARAAVNRMWLELNGLGFVGSYDGFSPRAEVLHGELLDLLARNFADHDYDLKWLMRTIVLSRLFQLEHGAGPDVRKNWNAIPPRLLNGDQWLDSVVRATGEEQRIYNLANEITPLLEQENSDRVAGKIPWDPRSEQSDKAKTPPPAQESLDLPPEQLRLKGLRTEYAEIGERIAQLRARARTPMSPSTEALMSMNGEIAGVSLQRGTTAANMATLPTRSDRIEAGFLTVLGRRPADDERDMFSDQPAADPVEDACDILWTLLQSTEFKTY